jgi:hypothetical protein
VKLVLTSWMTHTHSQARSRAKEIQSQLEDARRQQARLLNLHLAGTVDEPRTPSLGRRMMAV